MNYYTELSKQVISQDKDVMEFKERLDTKYGSARNICLYKSRMYKACHLVTSIRAKIVFRRLGTVREEFYNFLDSDVIGYVRNEPGSLESRLEDAARIYKPEAARNYVKRRARLVRRR